MGKSCLRRNKRRTIYRNMNLFTTFVNNIIQIDLSSSGEFQPKIEQRSQPYTLSFLKHSIHLRFECEFLHYSPDSKLKGKFDVFQK